ncbi:MAG: hypothetical protein C6I00_06785 [Nitratiruptor sp.]|nr:hypothetical protein [Nitratiruptor sp.]NPA83742.1 hypothetical protein [Campylobacterota bacterium]
MANVEKSLQKVALVLDRLVQKVEEIDKRLKRVEERVLNSSQEEGRENKGPGRGMELSKGNMAPSQEALSPRSTSSFGANAGASFLGSLAGVVAGMGLYHLLFDDGVEPKEMAEKMGMDESALEGIEERLAGIEEQLEDLDQELDALLAQEEDGGLDGEEFVSLDDYLASEEGEMGGFDEDLGVDEV